MYRRNRRERLKPLFRRRIAADVVAVAAKRHGDGIDGFPDEQLRARYLLGAALPGDGEDERAEDHESEDDDGVEDDALLHRRCSAAERRALRGILALDRLDGGDAFLLLRVLRRELLPKRVVVDHCFAPLRRLYHIHKKGAAFPPRSSPENDRIRTCRGGRSRTCAALLRGTRRSAARTRSTSRRRGCGCRT